MQDLISWSLTRHTLLQVSKVLRQLALSGVCVSSVIRRVVIQFVWRHRLLSLISGILTLRLSLLQGSSGFKVSKSSVCMKNMKRMIGSQIDICRRNQSVILPVCSIERLQQLIRIVLILRYKEFIRSLLGKALVVVNGKKRYMKD